MTELNEAEKLALALCLVETALKRGKNTWPVIISIAQKTGVTDQVVELAKEIKGLHDFLNN